MLLFIWKRRFPLWGFPFFVSNLYYLFTLVALCMLSHNCSVWIFIILIRNYASGFVLLRNLELTHKIIFLPIVVWLKESCLIELFTSYSVEWYISPLFSIIVHVSLLLPRCHRRISCLFYTLCELWKIVFLRNWLLLQRSIIFVA